MKYAIITFFTLLIGLSSTALLYSAKRASGYIPLPKEVLTKQEYITIYHGSLPLDQRLSKLKQLRKKYKSDSYKLKGVNRGIREIEFQMSYAR